MSGHLWLVLGAVVLAVVGLCLALARWFVGAFDLTRANPTGFYDEEFSDGR